MEAYVRLRSLAFVLPLAIAADSPASAQTIFPNGIINAASLQPSVAAGSIVSILGTSLADGTVAASTVPLPNTLGGTSVLVNGTPAPTRLRKPTMLWRMEA